MPRTEELMKLAEAANENATKDDWGSRAKFELQYSRFIAAATPETIKQLVELVRLQNAALIELSPCMHKECCQLQNQTQDHAITAFNKFEQGGK